MQMTCKRHANERTDRQVPSKKDRAGRRPSFDARLIAIDMRPTNAPSRHLHDAISMQIARKSYANRQPSVRQWEAFQPTDWSTKSNFSQLVLFPLTIVFCLFLWQEKGGGYPVPYPVAMATLMGRGEAFPHLVAISFCRFLIGSWMGRRPIRGLRGTALGKWPELMMIDYCSLLHHHWAHLMSQLWGKKRQTFYGFL